MPSSSCRKWRHPGYGCPTSWGASLFGCFCLLELYDNHGCWILSFYCFMFFFFICVYWVSKKGTTVPHFQVPSRIWTATSSHFGILNWFGWCGCCWFQTWSIFKFPATRLLILIPNHKTTIWNDLFTMFHWLVLWNYGILWLSRNSWEWNNHPNWRTPSFFRGLGGSTTKHFTIFTMFPSHGGMTIPICWCLQALFEDGVAMDASRLMERGQAWRQERLRGSNLTQDPPSRWWVQMIGRKLGKWCGTMLDHGWHRILMGFLRVVMFSADFMGISQKTIVFCSKDPPISMIACTLSILAWKCLQAPFSGSHLDFSGCIRLA